jgi:uncharacterized delta-60 repeat protein
MLNTKLFKSSLLRIFIAMAFAVLFLSSNILPPAHAAAGDPDLTFGSGGQVTTDFFDNRDELTGMAIQSDGKIVLAGTVQSSKDFLSSDFGVARYNTDGSLDNSFGTGGKVTTDFFGSLDEAKSVAIQPDGKIVVVGHTLSNTGLNVGLVRYNTDGSLDLTFGTGGKVNTLAGIGSLGVAVGIQPNGKIVVGGSISNAGSQNDFLVIRYNTDGTLDNSFGAGGVVTTDFFGINAFDFVNALVIQPDGKIVAGGLAEKTPEPFSYDFGLVRYNTDGSLDPTFGVGGKASAEFMSGTKDYCEAIALQSDGKIVAAGQVTTTSLSVVDFALARFNTNGSLDNSFGAGGKVTTDFFNNNDGALDVVIQPDGKIIAAGFDINGFTGGDIALARYNTNGSLDNSFGTGGKISSDFGSAAEEGRAVALQSDGKILAAGIVNGFSLETFDFAVGRYNGDGSSFDICLQDDSNGNLFQFNSTTGDYKFSNCRKGFTLTGRGTVSVRFCKVELQAVERDRNISVSLNTCTHTGTASVQDSTRKQTYTITDRDITNNTCSCR